MPATGGFEPAGRSRPPGMAAGITDRSHPEDLVTISTAEGESVFFAGRSLNCLDAAPPSLWRANGTGPARRS